MCCLVFFFLHWITLLTFLFDALSRRTVPVLQTEVCMLVIAGLALTHPVIHCSALLLYNLVLPAKGGTIQALWQVIVKLSEVIEGAWRTGGVLLSRAGRLHVEACRTSFASQHLTAHRVPVLEGKWLRHTDKEAPGDRQCQCVWNLWIKHDTNITLRSNTYSTHSKCPLAYINMHICDMFLKSKTSVRLKLHSTICHQTDFPIWIS